MSEALRNLGFFQAESDPGFRKRFNYRVVELDQAIAAEHLSIEIRSRAGGPYLFEMSSIAGELKFEFNLNGSFVKESFTVSGLGLHLFVELRKRVPRIPSPTDFLGEEKSGQLFVKLAQSTFEMEIEKLYKKSKAIQELKPRIRRLLTDICLASVEAGERSCYDLIRIGLKRGLDGPSDDIMLVGIGSVRLSGKFELRSKADYSPDSVRVTLWLGEVEQESYPASVKKFKELIEQAGFAPKN
ncbi:hypothetical protein M1307_03745 [Patescibacteria group bacterium]|nr:hypothetical protein [Patescibacteria group bacterium]